MSDDAKYADDATAARYLQGRMDEQAAWVEAVKEARDLYAATVKTCTDHRLPARRHYIARMDALDALLRRMGAE